LYGETVDVVALGTNAIATAQMPKAGTNRGASGENTTVQTTESIDIIPGPLGIIIALAMMGEVTPGIAAGVAGSPAAKFLLPLTQENVTIVGAAHLPLPHLIEELIDMYLHNFIT
jgi:hypothetical protein